MDVQCPACKTEYEFDDALVSERGTTVRCTTCAHQFKLRRPESVAAPAPDRWLVRTSDGQELVFTSLRDLQRAILSRQVQRGDLLTRGEAPRRQLGSIAELEPFFEGKRTSRPPPAPEPGSGARLPPPPPPMRSRMSSIPPANESVARGTQLGMGVPAMTTNTAGSVVVELAAMRRAASSAAPGPGPTRQASGTLRPPSNRSAAVPPPSAHDDDDDDVLSSSALLNDPPPSEAALTIRRPTDPPPFARGSSFPRDSAPSAIPAHRAPSVTRPFPPVQGSQPPSPMRSPSQPPLPPPTIVVDTPSVAAEGAGYGSRNPSYSMPPAEGVGLYSVAPPRRRKGGWVLAAVLLAAVGGVGFVIARPYLAPAPPVAVAAALDPRAQQFLRDGERALADGNLDGAKENFDKASALAENEPHVTAAVARFATARADIPWLHLRLVAADASDDVKLAKRELEEQSSRAKKAAEEAVASAPDDGTALRLKADALRLVDQKDAARAVVPKLLASSTQPETAYVLAMLDASDADPLWPPILDRLRLAAGSEGNAGRARAALVYALARSGDVAGARAELERLNALPRPYPLTSLLRAFVEKAPTVASKRADAGVAPPAGPVVDVSSLPSGSTRGVSGGGGGAGSGTPSDPRTALQQGDLALRKGDYERARTMFQAVLAKNPSDSEALAGLGDAARAQRDAQGAQNYYRQALAANPTYLPALIGLGDVQWDLGDKATAQKTYKDIGERFPESAYPARVKARADGTPLAPAPTPAPAAPAPSGTVVEDYNGSAP